jgi:hypothetical protein
MRSAAAYFPAFVGAEISLTESAAFPVARRMAYRNKTLLQTLLDQNKAAFGFGLRKCRRGHQSISQCCFRSRRLAIQFCTVAVS